MALDVDKAATLSGLSEPEAKEFHKIFVTSFLAFTAVAVVAHIRCGSGGRGCRVRTATRPRCSTRPTPRSRTSQPC